MNVYSIRLNEYGIRSLYNNIENPIDNNKLEMILCIIFDSYRPIFIKSNKYKSMNELLTYLNRKKNYITIFDKNNNTNILHDDFINMIIEATKNASKDIKELRNADCLINISENIYFDDISTIWYKGELFI